MSSKHSCFHFPPELELKIITLAARLDYTTTARQLCFVSQHIYSWVKPILYESLYPSSQQKCQQLCQTLDTFPSSFAATAIKTLFIYGPEQPYLHLLQMGKGIHHLLLLGAVPYDSVADHRPSRLQLAISDVTNVPNGDLFSTPFLSQVTHLELFALNLDLPFHLLSHLTHLAFNTGMHRDWEDLHTLGIAKLLRESPGIQKLLLFHSLDPTLTRPGRDFLKSLTRILPPDAATCTYLGDKQRASQDWLDHLDGRYIWDRGIPLAQLVIMA